MPSGRRIAMLNQALARYRAGQISRRQVLGLLGALGLSTAAAPRLLNRDAVAKSAPGGAHAGHMLPARQEGTPPPVATPQLGERPDGTRVWRVQVGAFDPAELVDAMAFFPEEITINAGDAIFFDFGQPPRFHTATFPSGEDYPRLIVPDEAAGTPTAGGLPRLVLNPAAAFPSQGGSYDGTGLANSGLPLDPAAPPFVLTFTTPGTYEYLCLVHPTPMRATVVVQEQGAAYPNDQANYDQLAAEQAAALLEEGRALVAQHAAATPASGGGGATVHEVAAGVGGEQVEAYRFLPKELAISAGDTVRWTNRSLHDPHTVTFLGGEEPPEFIMIEPQEGGPPTLVLNPVVMSPAGGPVFDGTGLANSGWLQREAAEVYEGFPREGEVTYELTFDTPGEYRYYCAIHAGGPDDEQGMTGIITVS